MKYFCTLFNNRYLSRGSLMIRSLLNVDPESCIYVYVLDKVTSDALESLHCKQIVIIRPEQFEDSELLRVKPTRTVAEYCWTLTASVIKHAILNFKLPECTYIDADLFFYTSTLPLFEELKDKSIGIIEHGFSEDLLHLNAHGKYNVQFMYFKNDNYGLQALSWWRERCIEWCFSRVEDGKFGDQLYLNDWPVRFDNVGVIQHTGAGVAPWNIQRFQVEVKNSIPYVKEKNSKETPVIFFHFHATKIFKLGYGISKGYPSNKSGLTSFFIPYAENLINEHKILSRSCNLKIIGTFENDKMDLNLKLAYKNWKLNDFTGTLHFFPVKNRSLLFKFLLGTGKPKFIDEYVIRILKWPFRKIKKLLA